MQAISLERSIFTRTAAQTAIVSLATFTSLALLGLVLAYWTWAWLAPRPEPRAPAAVPTTMQTGGRAAVGSGPTQAASGLFGSAERNRNGAAPTGIAIKLLGIVAATGGRSAYAVVQLDAKQILAVRVGKNVAPGIRLAEVHTDHVVLERGGMRETLAWPKQEKSAVAAAPRSNN